MAVVAVVACILGAGVWTYRAANARKRMWVIAEHEKFAEMFRKGADRHAAQMSEYASYERRARELLESGEFSPAEGNRRIAHWRHNRESLDWDWRRGNDEARWYAERAEFLRRQEMAGTLFDFEVERRELLRHMTADQTRLKQRQFSPQTAPAPGP